MVLCLRRKAFYLVLAICVIFPVFFTETMVAAEFDHDCVAQDGGCYIAKKEYCQPCLLIQAAKYFLKTFEPIIAVSCFSIPLIFSAQSSEHFIDTNYYPLSLIELKVRFNS